MDPYIEANPIVALHEEYAECAALFDPETGTGFALNPVGVLIWNHLDGRHSLADLVGLIESTFHEVPKEAETHVQELVSALVQKGLAGYVFRTDHVVETPLPTIVTPGPRSGPAKPPYETPTTDIRVQSDKNMEFFYQKTSMVPTFEPGELLRVSSIEAEKIRAGDIIVFHSPYSGERVTHRVLRVTPLGLVTRGDNVMCGTDPWILTPDQIVGVVTHAGRDERRRAVRGGFRGLLTHHLQRLLFRTTRAFRRSILPPRSRLRIGRLLEPIDLTRLLPRKHRPRLLAVARPSGYELMLLMGKRPIARKPPRARFWSVRFFYLPFVDVKFVRSTGRRLLAEEEDSFSRSGS